jgi:SPP1 gp7 family putative phage head morphogenesis protein
MARSDEYWDRRALNRLTDAEKQSEKYIARIEKMYDQAERNIQREIEAVYRNYSKSTGMDVQSLKTLLTKTETEKLWEDLKRQGLDKYVKGNYKARITRLERIEAEIYAKAKQVYPQEQKAHTELYNGVVRDGYYKTIYDTQVGTGADFAFAKIDDNMVSKLLNEKWSGKNYSQRIWGNTDLLAESLSEIIGGALLSGQSIAKTSRQIRERFDVSKYYADRLVRTETNHFNNEADAMAYDEMGLDKYVFRATLDTRTSTKCQDMDGEVIPLKEREVGKNFPPLHPNCRSKTRAYMGEEIEATLKRRARNPITGKNEIVGNISYKEWKKRYANLSDLDHAQEYRPIILGADVSEMGRGKTIIETRKVENSSYKGGVYISNSVSLKPKQMHNITKSINESVKIVGVGDDLPKCVIISPNEMQTPTLCSYNAEKNTMYINSVICNKKTLLELQEISACPNNPLSTYVHEFIHWKEAEKYKTKATLANQKEYLSVLRRKCKVKLDKLEKQGYNIHDISEYASENYKRGKYDETYAEYQVKMLLKE